MTTSATANTKSAGAAASRKYSFPVECFVRTSLENMSCPPRSQVTVRPLAVEPLRPERTWANPEPQVPASGLRIVMRIRFDELIRRTLQEFTVAPDGEVNPLAAQDGERHAERARLLAALKVLSTATSTGPIDPAVLLALRDRPIEVLKDAIAVGVRKLNGRMLDLPAFGFMRPADEYPGLRAPVEDNAVRALFVLCHWHGGLFVRDADPIPQVPSEAVDLVSSCAPEDAP